MPASQRERTNVDIPPSAASAIHILFQCGGGVASGGCWRYAGMPDEDLRTSMEILAAFVLVDLSLEPTFYAANSNVGHKASRPAPFFQDTVDSRATNYNEHRSWALEFSASTVATSSMLNGSLSSFHIGPPSKVYNSIWAVLQITGHYIARMELMGLTDRQPQSSTRCF